MLFYLHLLNRKKISFKKNIYARNFPLFWNSFFYFSNEHLLVHVHIKTNECTAKFEVEPLTLIENKGLKMKDIYLAESIIEENKELILKHWNDFFNANK